MEEHRKLPSTEFLHVCISEFSGYIQSEHILSAKCSAKLAICNCWE